MELDKIVYLVLAMLTIFLVSVVFVQWVQTAEKAEQVSQCKSSIQLASASKQTQLISKTPNLDCKTDYINISSGQDYERETAEALYKCSDQWWQGKDLLLFEDEGIYCQICSIINYTDDIKITDFDLYLANEKLTKGINKGKLTYQQYLTGYESSYADWEVDQYYEVRSQGQTSVNLDGNNDYAVIFLYAKGDDSVKKYISSIAAVAGSTAVATGTYTAYTGVAYAAGYFATVEGGVIATVLSAPVATSAALGVSTTVATGGLVLIVAGIGAVALAVSNNYLTDQAAYMSQVVLREYSTDALQSLGCTHLPVTLSGDSGYDKYIIKE